jgi:AAA domain/RepB DNA-primase from phage plasmid
MMNYKDNTARQNAVAFDRVAIRNHVELIHKQAIGIDGVLVVSAIYTSGPGPITHHPVGDVEGTIEAIMAHENTPNVNMYMGLQVMRRGLARNSRGKESDIVAVIGLVADNDADTGKVGELPLKASYVVETSPGNSQAAIVFDQPMAPADAKRLAKDLQRATGSDSGTGDIAHIWRIAGTLNYPSATKLARGRSPEPVPVFMVEPFDGQTYSPETLSEALAPYAAAENANTSTDRFRQRVEAAPLWERVSDLGRAALTGDGKPDRSRHLARVVERLHFERFGLDEIVSLCLEHGGAWSEKFRGDNRRMIKDIENSWNKFAVPKEAEEKANAQAADDFLRKCRKRKVDDDDTIDAETLLGMEFAELSFVVPGYIVEGLTILGGKPKLGKSWLALDVGIAVATGGKAMNAVECEQGDVIYLALEDNYRRMQERIRMLAPPFRKKAGIDLSRLKIRTAAPRIDEGLLDALDQWRTSAKNPRLIIIDVYMKVRPPRKRSEDAYAADYAAVLPLQKYASDHRLAIVLVTHTRKMEAEDPLESISGTNGVTGAADAVLVLSRGANGTTLYGRGRDIEEIETAMNFNGGKLVGIGQRRRREEIG